MNTLEKYPELETQEKPLEIYLPPEKNPLDEFVETMPVLYQNYKTALQTDLKETFVDPQTLERKGFAWGELNRNATRDFMFENAMKKVIQIEFLERKNLGKEGLNQKEKFDLEDLKSTLSRQFGPEKSHAGEVIKDMKRSVNAIYESKPNLTDKTLTDIFLRSNYKIESKQ